VNASPQIRANVLQGYLITFSPASPSILESSRAKPKSNLDVDPWCTPISFLKKQHLKVRGKNSKSTHFVGLYKSIFLSALLDVCWQTLCCAFLNVFMRSTVLDVQRLSLPRPLRNSAVLQYIFAEPSVSFKRTNKTNPIYLFFV